MEKFILKRDDLMGLGGWFDGIDEIRFLNCCLVGLEQKELLSETQYYPVNIDRYADKSGLSVSKAYEEVKLFADKLKHIDLKIKLGSSIWITSFIYDYVYDDLNKTIHIQWNKKIIPAISGEMLPGTFCYYDSRMDSVSSNKSYRLAELLQRYLWHIRQHGSYQLDIDLIRKQTGTEKLYIEYKELNRWVIQPALKDLEKHIGVKLDAIKKRGADYVTFMPAKNKINAIPANIPEIF